MILSPLIFAIAYAVKGGQLGHIIPHVETLRKRNKVFNRLFDGKVLSTLILLIYTSFITVYYQVNLGMLPSAWMSCIAIVLAWLGAVAPSVGEENDALMNKGAYVDSPEFGRVYGIKKALQRGVWMGALMTLVTGYEGFILASFLYVPLVWLALNYTPDKVLDSWGWSEVLIGVVLFGLPFYLMGI